MRLRGHDLKAIEILPIFTLSLHLGSMRVTGGKAKGIPLQAKAGRKGFRPATDRTREAVFSSLAGRVVGAKVLDLYAGSGAYGLESLSRGARQVDFVERNLRTIRCLRCNLQAVVKSIGSASPQVRVCRGEVMKWVGEGGYDIIFADPPYQDYPSLLEPLLQRFGPMLNKHPEASLIIEMPRRVVPQSESLGGIKVKRILGKSGSEDPNLVFFQMDSDFS